MDFNEIKNIWKNTIQDEQVLNKEEIESRLRIKSKSNTALNKVKRNYKIELYSGGIMALFFLGWMYVNLPQEYKWIIIIITILFFGILYSFTWRNYIKVSKIIIPSEQLKPSLTKTIKDIQRYVNFNKSNFTKFLLLPFAICYGMFIGLFMGLEGQDILEVLSLQEMIKIGILLIVLSALFIPISQYFNKKMYKKHLDELKQCLKEFEEIED